MMRIGVFEVGEDGPVRVLLAVDGAPSPPVLLAEFSTERSRLQALREADLYVSAFVEGVRRVMALDAALRAALDAFHADPIVVTEQAGRA